MIYKKQIFQCWASSPMEEHFANDLRKKWSLTKYVDPYKPALFFGWYLHQDFIMMQNHKAPFVMLWGGRDMTKQKIEAVNNLPNSYQIGYGWQSNILKHFNIKHKEVVVPIKSYDMFQPTNLGDKVYLYRGWLNAKNDYYHWDKMVKPLFNEFGEDKFIYTNGKDINYVYENLYKKSFLYIKPNVRGGSTSMWELGHMGIKTVSNEQGDAPNVIPYSTIDDVIDIINEESKKIGTLQTDVAETTRNFLDVGEKWLNINYYE